MRISDWSSDVCSSDLRQGLAQRDQGSRDGVPDRPAGSHAAVAADRAAQQGERGPAAAAARQRPEGAVLAPVDTAAGGAGRLGWLLGLKIKRVQVSLRHIDEPASSEEHTYELKSLMRN